MTTYNSNRWNEWIKAAFNGDKSSYRLLLTNLRPWLMAYFSKRIHKEAVEDLVQETLMSLHSKMHTYNPEKPFGPWISAVARHRWIDYMRKTLKYIELEFNEEIFIPDENKERGAKDDIKKLLKLIPPAQAEVIDLVKLQEMTIEEASNKTGHSQSSVKVMIHRGIKKMAAAVKEADYE